MGDDGGRSHYTILGVGQRATSSEIRVAYLNLARALHPDRVLSGTAAEQQLAERRMREVNEAYEVLGNADRRSSYDRDHFGSASSARPSASRPTAQRPPAPVRRPTGNPERFDADPSWRDDDGHLPHRAWGDDEDDVEVSPAVAFLLRRGPLIAVLVLAAFLFIATAYAGGGSVDDPEPTVTTVACNDAPIDGITGGSVVLEPC